MGAYVSRRILLMIPTALLVTFVVFFSVRFIPGHVIELMVFDLQAGAGQEQQVTIESLKRTLGLDKPLHVQYVHWLGDLVQGDLGTSLWSREPVREEIFDRLAVSLELGLIAVISGLLLSVSVGVYSAMRQDTAGDYLARTLAILAISLPSFWIGTMVIVYPSIWWNWTPVLEFIPITEDLWGNLAQCAIPGIILGMVLSGTTMRMTRTMMLEVLRQDYIRTAWSKGLREKIIILRHAMKNAMIPVVTLVGLQLPILIGGTVIVEQIFNLPGIGRLMLEALTRRDYPIISGINVVLAAFVLVVNLLIDLTYAYLDPRIRINK
jgi:peptide/nickel transport system permease protein